MSLNTKHGEAEFDTALPMYNNLILYLEVLLSRVPAHENRNKRNEYRTEPGSNYHAHSRVGVHEVVVVEGFDNGVEPVK